VLVYAAALAAAGIGVVPRRLVFPVVAVLVFWLLEWLQFIPYVARRDSSVLWAAHVALSTAPMTAAPPLIALLLLVHDRNGPIRDWILWAVKWPIRGWILSAGSWLVLLPFLALVLPDDVIAVYHPKTEQIQRPVWWFLWHGKWEIVAGFTMVSGLVSPRIYRTQRAQRVGLWVHVIGLAAVMHAVYWWWDVEYAYSAAIHYLLQNHSILSESDRTQIYARAKMLSDLLIPGTTVIPALLSLWLFKNESRLTNH
jgi:hypothetical protein